MTYPSITESPPLAASDAVRATFAYHRSLGPLVGVILALACVEAFVVHIIAVAWWGWTVAVVIGLLDLAVVIALTGLLRSFRRCPVVLEDGVLVMRTGARLRCEVPLGEISGFRATWTAEDLKAPHVLNMALAAWPNIVFDLHRPIRRRRKSVTTIAHCFDDPAAFRRATAAALPKVVV